MEKMYSGRKLKGVPPPPTYQKKRRNILEKIPLGKNAQSKRQFAKKDAQEPAFRNRPKRAEAGIVHDSTRGTRPKAMGYGCRSFLLPPKSTKRCSRSAKLLGGTPRMPESRSQVNRLGRDACQKRPTDEYGSIGMKVKEPGRKGVRNIDKKHHISR